MARALPFTSPWLLAPMEGVTEPSFRERVLERNGPEALGGTFTEFVRVVRAPLPRRVLRAHLGTPRFPQPVGLQLMGSDPDALAATAARAVEVGAPLVDLNFGCPAKGALRGCAGAALLDEPERVQTLVRAVRRGLGDGPLLCAKIRAGGEDDRLVEDLARAVEAGGADLLTVHARTRREGYGPPADWRRLERAVGAVSIPVCGNGGVLAHTDLARLRAETGCTYAMVGRAALGNPWIFSGRAVDASEAAGFLLDYAAGLMETRGASLDAAARRVKQLLNHWSAGGLVGEAGERSRGSFLRERDPARLLGRLERIAGSKFGESSGFPGTCEGRAPSKAPAQLGRGPAIS